MNWEDLFIFPLCCRNSTWHFTLNLKKVGWIFKKGIDLTLLPLTLTAILV